MKTLCEKGDTPELAGGMWVIMLRNTAAQVNAVCGVPRRQGRAYLVAHTPS